MAQSGYDAEFLRMWQDEGNETIDDVVTALNTSNPPEEGKKPNWDKKLAQKEAARYRKAGVNLRKFSKASTLLKINADEAKKFLESLNGESNADADGDGDE